MSTLDDVLEVGSGQEEQPARRLELRGAWLPASMRFLFVVCVLTVAAGLAFDAARVWQNVLLCGNYMTGLGLAAMFFLAVHDLSNAGWATVIRRVPIAFTALVPAGSVLVLAALAFGGESVYSWMGHDAHLTGFKAVWLSLPFFAGRALVFVAAWIAFGRAFARSTASDVEGVQRDVRRGALFVVVFAFSVWLSSVDWIMSIEPLWYSTMFGVYRFSGMFSAGIAAITIAVVALERRGALHGVVTEHHLHDLGKMMFAFSTFWMYIWFSQYMLIWYGNIAEESAYFVPRTTGVWGDLMIANVLLNWVIPFVVLMPARMKMNRKVLVRIAGAILVGQWLDLFIAIFPTKSPVVPPAGIWELAAFTAAAIASVALVQRSLTSRPLLAEEHPLFEESRTYHG